jgi:hypothetical protein
MMHHALDMKASDLNSWACRWLLVVVIITVVTDPKYDHSPRVVLRHRGWL